MQSFNKIIQHYFMGNFDKILNFFSYKQIVQWKFLHKSRNFKKILKVTSKIHKFGLGANTKMKNIR